jgi:prevent-host-death family protein
MKTATVRDLRNRFADVAKWIEHGEQVSITRNGKPFAMLSATTSKKPGKADWAARMKRFTPVGEGLTKAQIEKVWSDMRD